MSGTTAWPMDLPGVTPISRETLQDHVYKQLTDLILDGEIAPGELVTIQRLAGAFGTSAMPVREALKRMTAANVLTVVSGRSIGIAPLTAARLDDLRKVRREVEPLAAEWAVGKAGPDVIAELETHMEEMIRWTARDEIKAFLRANRAFHFCVYRAAGSETLDAIIETLWLQISPYFHLLVRSGRASVNNIEHEAMLKALKAKDAEAMRVSLRRDIDLGCGVIAGLLP